jgi:predicted Zn-dependent peptidase
LTVVGDIDPDRLCREVEDHLAHLRSGSPRQEPPRAAHSKPGDAYYEIVGPNVRYTCAYVAYRLPGYAHPGWLEGSLFARAIALGRSSPLRRELARQKIAHDIRVYIEPREDATTVAFVARAVPGVSTTELERVFVTTLERAIGGEVRVADVERARKSELIALQMNADKLVVRTEHLARATMLRRWYSTPNDLDLLQQGLPSSILADGRHMFAANDRVRLVVASSPSNS